MSDGSLPNFDLQQISSPIASASSTGEPPEKKRADPNAHLDSGNASGSRIAASPKPVIPNLPVPVAPRSIPGLHDIGRLFAASIVVDDYDENLFHKVFLLLLLQNLLSG